MMKKAILAIIAIMQVWAMSAQELTVTYQAVYDTASPQLFADAGLPEDMRASLAAAYKDVVMKYQLVVKEDESDFRVLPGEGKQEIHFMGQTMDVNAALAMQAQNYTYKNHAEGIVLDKTQVFGKDFIVSDSIGKAKFSVVKGETKEILGYECQKAISEDGKTVVWFTPQIPVKDEPIATGLPGLALQMDYLGQTFTAIKVEDTAAKEIIRPTGEEVLSQSEFKEWVKKRTDMMKRN